MNDSAKMTVMLHYTQYGSQRSPNVQFDLLRAQPLLNSEFNFVTLDQKKLPREIGHIRSIRLLKKEIEAVHPDVVHIIGVKEGFHCMIASVLAGCKKRILITHGFAGLSSKNNRLKRAFYSWIIEPIVLLLATDVQCNSAFSYRLPIIQRFAKKKSVVIYNFLEPFTYLPEHTWRKQHDVSESDFVIATIGNMHVGKGYDILERVIAHYQDQAHVKFVIMGDGTLKESFDHQLSGQIETKKVFSLGKVIHDDAMQILSECNLFFLPTRFETLGMVFAEAAFCGVPVVGTKVGAVGEIVIDGQTGFLINMNDLNTAIEKIDVLLRDKELCSAYGVQGKKRIKTLLSSDSTASAIRQLYKKGM